MVTAALRELTEARAELAVLRPEQKRLEDTLRTAELALAAIVTMFEVPVSVMGGESYSIDAKVLLQARIAVGEVNRERECRAARRQRRASGWQAPGEAQAGCEPARYFGTHPTDGTATERALRLAVEALQATIAFWDTGKAWDIEQFGNACIDDCPACHQTLEDDKGHTEDCPQERTTQALAACRAALGEGARDG